jgi:hypothetical protein
MSAFTIFSLTGKMGTKYESEIFVKHKVEGEESKKEERKQL